jgi:hypothetical protein
MTKQVDQKEMIDKVRAAIKDRATWLALLVRSFKAIFEFGRMKAKNDPRDFSPAAWVEKHVSKGSSLVFDSDVEINDKGAVQRMKFCALVEAWKEMGCTPQEIDLFCDIAMEGDRGRADAHGVRMELEERIARGDKYCHLKILDR